MKTSVLKFAILTFVTFLWSTNLLAQCNSTQHYETAEKALEEGFTLTPKRYRVDGTQKASQKIKYTIVLAKGTEYQFLVASADGGADGIILTLLDVDKNEVATNYREKTFHERTNYTCTKTGIYYLVFTFKDTDNYCGGAVIGFKR